MINRPGPPEVANQWSDPDWDRTWDAAEPPQRPKRPRSLLSRLVFALLVAALLAAGSDTGLAYYSVNQTINAFNDGSADQLARFVAVDAVDDGLVQDFAATPEPAGIGNDSVRYLGGIAAGLADAWHSPAAIRDMVRRRVVDPSLGETDDMIADHVTRIQLFSPARLAIDLSGSDPGEVAVGLCMGFQPQRAPVWQVDRLAWNADGRGC